MNMSSFFTKLWLCLRIQTTRDQGVQSVQITKDNYSTLLIVARRIQQSRKRAQGNQPGTLNTIEFDSVILSAVEQLESGSDVQYMLGFENNLYTSSWFTLTASWSIGNSQAKPSSSKKMEQTAVVKDLIV